MATIQSSDLLFFPAESVTSSAATNGGRMGSSQIVSGVSGGVFPDVPQSERLAGSVTRRKLFFANRNTANATLFNAMVFLDQYTQGDDAVYMIPTTQTGYESSISGAAQRYGCGGLGSSVSSGSNTLYVDVENGAVPIFKDGMTIRITDKATPTSDGNAEYHTLSGAPTVAGNRVTLKLAGVLTNSYNYLNTRVSSVMVAGDIAGNYSAVSENTAGNGVFVPESGGLTVHNVGGIEDTFTLTFTSATAFQCSGTLSGSLGTGNMLAAFSPVNTKTSTPLFTIDPKAFTGTFTTGDTVVFTTNPSAYPVFMERVIPAGAAAITGNKFTIGIDGETA